MNRLYLSRFKSLVYGPREFAQGLRRRCNGSEAQLKQRYSACQTDAAHWDFAVEHFAPCQKKAEIFGFLDWAQSWSPQTILEIGVARGGTNYLLRNCIPSVTQLVGVDFYPRNKSLHRKLTPDSVRLDFVQGASAAPNTVDRVRRLLNGQPVDLLFIDGDHSYAGAMADFEAYRALVRQGGWVAFHDIVPQERDAQGRAVNGFEVEVDRVWQELSQNRESVSFIENDGRSSYGIGALREG